MRTQFFIFLSLLAWLTPLVDVRILQNQPSAPAILSPLAGQVLQGSQPIHVDTSVEGFRSARLYFGYTADPTHTWFLIQESDAALINAVMAQWDTTTITDGNYSLRLVVIGKDEKALETQVDGLRVRNYSPVETDTPAPPTPTSTLKPGEVVSATPTPTQIARTATPLPTNPAEMTFTNITNSMGNGALVILGLFGVLGGYIWIRARFRTR